MPILGLMWNIPCPAPGPVGIRADDAEFFVVASTGDLAMDWDSQEWPPDAPDQASTADGQSAVAERFVESCRGELDAWQAGLVPSDRYWVQWNDEPAPWCSEFVGWNLQNIGLVLGETMPPDPSYAEAYYSFYSERPDLAEVHENDGTYVPKAGDIVLFSEFSHTEMVERLDEDGLGWSGISGGSSVNEVHRDLSDGSCQWFITLR